MDLRAVEVEAEEIRRRIDVGCLKRGGAAVDERNLRLGLCIIVKGDAFRARKGAIRISTLSCSTSFLAARRAEFGLASDDPLMISSSLPPALL